MRMMNERRRARTDESGFSLIELVITVAILGIISVVLLGVVFEYLKASRSAQTRLNESTDQQFISTYWQADVSSIGRRNYLPGTTDPVPTTQSVFVGSAGPGGCGSALGPVVVAFAWIDYTVNATVPANAWTSTAQEVAYVRVGSGAPYMLQRVRCKAGVAGPPITVARSITGPPTISCDTSCTAATLPQRVSMQFNVRDTSQPDSVGYTTTVSADRRQG